MIIGITGKAGSGKDTAADILCDKYGLIRIALADKIKQIVKDLFKFSDDQLWGSSEMRNKPDPRYFIKNGVTGHEIICYGCGHIYFGSPIRCPQCDYRGNKSHQSNIVGPIYLTPRHACQQLGTEYGRSCYPNIWVDYCLNAATKVMYGQEHKTHDKWDYDQKRGLFPWNEGPMNDIKGVVIPDVRFKNEADAIRAHGGVIWRITRDGAGLKGEAGAHISEQEQNDIYPEAILSNNSTLSDLRTLVEDVFDITFAAPLPETTADFEMVMQPTVTLPDGNQVLPDQPVCLDHLSGLLEKRQRDVDNGRILPLDLEQTDVPPFKRK